MTVLPIVARELRVASRRRATYWLRSGAALAVIVLGVWFFLMMWNSPPQESALILFGILSGASVLYCLLSGVRATSDCLSEEKREGTLGLLFLTDLKGYDVVLGKFVARSLNAFYGLLAFLPIMALPVMLGGVTRGEFWRTALALGNTLFISLASGIFVSTLTRNSRRSMGRTLLLLLLLAGLFPALAQLPSRMAGAPLLSCLEWISPFYPFSFAREAAYAGQPATFWTSLLCSNLLACFFIALSSRR